MLKTMINSGLQSVLNPNTQTRAWLRLITKRILRLAVAAALLLVILNVWNIASLQSQQQLAEHTRQLTQLTLSQFEHQAVQAIQQQQNEALVAAAQHLQQHHAVVSVVVRNPYGEVLVTQGNYDSVIDWPDDAPAKPWIMSRELTDNGTTAGYLQVIFDENKLMTISASAHDGLMQQGQVLLLLAMLAGVFIMLGFNRIRDRFWQQRSSAVKPEQR